MLKAIPILCHVLKTVTVPEIITDAAWAMSYMSDGGNDVIKMILKTGLVNGLLRFLTIETQIQMLVPILRIFGNLVTGPDEETD